VNQDQIIPELNRLVNEKGSRREVLQKVIDFLRVIRGYRWIGVYDVDHHSEEVRIIAFSGPGAPAFPVFPLNKGLTASAIATKRIVNVGDTTGDPRYLTAFASTLSELVIPILEYDVVIGTFDVESEKRNAFTEKEQLFLEKATGVIQPLWTRS
jgi:putative methionine-R-sulfoxide reductase with GAF domain